MWRQKAEKNADICYLRPYTYTLKLLGISRLIACSLASVLRGDLSLRWDVLSLCVHPVSLQMQSLRSIKELEYSLTLRTLDTNAANIVAINRYQYVRLLPARVGSAYSASTMCAIFPSTLYRAFVLVPSSIYLPPAPLRMKQAMPQKTLQCLAHLFTIGIDRTEVLERKRWPSPTPAL